MRERGERDPQHTPRRDVPGSPVARNAVYLSPRLLSFHRIGGPSVQFDLFPERVSVEQLDPKAVAGSQTRIVSMFVVRFERESAVHQVFVDNHGTYCADHGRDCRAVPEVVRFSRGNGKSPSRRG